MELTVQLPSNWPALAGMLSRIPPKNVPIALPLQLAVVGKDRPETTSLFAQWAKSDHPALQKAVAQATKGSA